MKNIKNFIKYNKIHVLLFFTSLLTAVLSFIFQDNTIFAEFMVEHIVNPIKRAIGTFTALFTFSMAEVVWVIFIIFIITFIIKGVIKIKKAQKGTKILIAICKILNLCTIAFTICTLAILSWGINYYIESPVTQMGVAQQEITVEQLEEATLLFINKINSVADKVERDENGAFNKDVSELFDESVSVFDNLQSEYPHLYWPQTQAKPMFFSYFMSILNYTGFYFSYTSEANVNDEQPLCFLPSTIAHELAHLRGVAQEQDANFLAILACETSGNANYEYSGYMLAYLHLSNELYKADKQAWENAYENLSELAKLDLYINNQYWAQFETPVAEVADIVYESYLQSNGQEDGLQSYGRVVDLLVDYYL